MQSCSVHHCVLLLLTLTFTTAPVADAVLPIQAKLHQRVTLPCAHVCSGEAKWTLFSTRSVFARCDQTSCSSVVKGYEMSHDQYLKGDLSLTITAAEYSMRDTYVCECGGIDYSEWRLSIDTVFSAVQKNPGEDLILDLTVPEPVEVIYTSSDSADGERICNVTQRSLQCKAEYTHRTSLSYPNITLRGVRPSDSGRYTIRDTENKEDIRVYSVAVTAVFSAVQKNPGEDLILDLSVPEPVEVIYTSSDSAAGERICTVTQRSLQCKAEYTHRTSLSYSELTLRGVRPSDSGRYTIRDTENNEDIRVYSVSVTGLSKGISKGMTAGIVVLVLLLVLGIIGVIIYKRRDVKKWREAEKKRRAAEELREVENGEQAVDGQMKQLLNLLQYENQRRKDQFNPHTKQMETILKNPEPLGSVMEELKKKLEEVEKMINDLEKRYRENREYKDRVGSFCNRRRIDLELCRNFYKTIQTGSTESDPGQVSRLTDSQQLMKMMMMMEWVIGNLESLRHCKSLQSRSFLYTHVDSGLNEIKSWCEKTRDDLKRFKEERGDEANAKLMIDTEALLSALGKWCEDKEEEMQKYKPKPVSAEHSENQPSESEPLNHNV